MKFDSDPNCIRTKVKVPEGGEASRPGAPRSVTVPTRLSADWRFA